jgi:hypothetical protein
MSTRKRKTIRKTAPLLGAAAAAGLFSVMGTAMAAQRVSKIVLFDSFANWTTGDHYSNPAPDHGFWGKGAGAGQVSRNHQRGGRGI